MQPKHFDRIVYVGAFLILLGVSFVVGIGLRESPRQEGLRFLADAARNYYSTYGEFPPAAVYDQKGARMHSWRVLLVPFIEANTFYDAYDFNAPWNAPVNISLAKKTKATNSHKDLAPAHVGEIYTQTRGKLSHADFTTDFLLLSRARPAMIAFRKVPTSNNRVLMCAVPSVPKELVIIQLDRTAIHWMEPRDLSLSRLPNGGDMPWEHVRDDIHASVKITESHVSYYNRSETITLLNTLKEASVK